MSTPGRSLRWLACSVVVFLAGALRGELLTIATYNIENYGPADRLTEDGYKKDYPKPEAEKQALRNVIRALHADILVVQEMGSQAYLDELQRDLKAEGLDYPQTALGVAADADRHVAILSRRPLKNVTTHTDLTISYFGASEPVKRGLLEATVTTSAGDLTLFAVHLKSQLTDRPDDPQSAKRRAAEATAVRDRVLRRFPVPEQARFLIIGDANDSKSSKTLEHLEKRGKTEVVFLLPAADSRGETWTEVYRREETYTRLDHVLVSPLLRPAVQGAAARIFDGEGVREASDHRPVIVTLDFKPISPG